MAYVPAQLRLLEDDVAGESRTWLYKTLTAADKIAACYASGFFSDSFTRGMKIGDKVTILETDSLTAPTTAFREDAMVTTAGTKASPAGTVTNPNTWVAGTAVAGAVTLAALRGKVTTESLTTAAAAEYTLTVTNSQIAATDVVLASVDPKTSAGSPGIGQCKVAAGSVVITVTNLHASAAFDNVIQVNFVVLKG